jgi:Flp pilus assembly protein TadD
MSDPAKSAMRSGKHDAGGIIAVAALLLSAGLFAAPTLPESWPLWGLGIHDNTPLISRLLWLPAAGLLASMIGLIAERASNRALTIWTPLGLTTTVMIALLLLPEATQLRAPGLSMMEDGGTPPGTGTHSLLKTLYQLILQEKPYGELLSFFRQTGLTALIFIGTAAWLFARELGGGNLRLLSFIVLLFSAPLAAMQGHASLEPVLAATIMWSIALTTVETRKNRIPLFGFLAACLAAVLTPYALCFLPAFVFVLIRGLGRGHAWIVFTIITLLCGAALRLTGTLLEAISLDTIINLPWKLAGLSNLVFLSMPAALVVLPAALIGQTGKRAIDGRAVGDYLLGSWVLLLLVPILLAEPTTPALTTAPVSLLALPGGAWILFRMSQNAWKVTPLAIASVGFIAALSTGGQLAVHASTGKSLDRYRSIAALYEVPSHLTELRIARFYHLAGDIQQEYRTLGDLKSGPDPRDLQYYLAQLALTLGDSISAGQHIDSMLALHPGDGDALFLQSKLIADSAERRSLLKKSVEVRSSKSDAYTQLAKLQVMEGRFELAEQTMLLGARKTVQHNSDYYAMFVIIEERLGKYYAARTFFSQIDSTAVTDSLYIAAKQAFERSRSAVKRTH